MSDDQVTRLLAEVNEHPRRWLIEVIAEVTFDNEEGEGGGKWWHLSQALALVERLPALSFNDADEVAAAEARGRKQAADEIAERFHEVVATYVHAVVHRGQWNWELDAKSKMEFVNGLTAVLTDDARACAAEQDTGGGDG